MSARPLANSDPFFKLIILFLISFLGVTIFMLMGNGLITALWGVDFFEAPGSITDYTNPQVVNINRVLLLFQHLGMFVVPSFAFALLISSNWKRVLGFRPARASVAVAAILVMIAALPLINALAWMNELLKFPEFLSGLEAAFAGMEESAAKLTKAITEDANPIVLAVNILTIAALPAIGEELIFRGLVIPIVRKWSGNVHTAVWVAAILFSAMHMQFYGFFPRMVLGAVLGYLFVWSGSVWIPIIAHFTNNAFALTMLFLMSRGTIPKEADEFALDATNMIWLAVSVVAVSGLMWFVFSQHKRNLL
ncbi:MAG: lysostaphin resistance A-like protein [Cryomorphaceae bacterium]|nr:CPBP family intramembrane metalloprotease [Flavobacteriales bacterium]